MNPEQNKNVLSGIRPAGQLHLGHLAGAPRNWIKLQEEYQAYHIELAHRITRRPNRLYGTVFPEPQIQLTEVPKPVWDTLEDGTQRARRRVRKTIEEVHSVIGF